MSSRAMIARNLVAVLVLAGCAGGTAAPAATSLPPTVAAEQPTAAPTEAIGTDSTAREPLGGVRTFTIVPGESEASFRLSEVLAGSPNTVIGTSRQLEGGFTLDFSDPGAVEFDPVRVQADALQTDDSRRDRAIERFILQAGQAGNQFITFQVREMNPLPEQVEVGATYPLELSGDLTVAGVTNEATFTGEVTATRVDRIEGTFETVVERDDYNLSIPQVPSVASVDDEVTLAFDFVATAP